MSAVALEEKHVRNLDEDPITFELQMDYRRTRKILVLPHRTVGRVLIALLVLNSVILWGSFFKDYTAPVPERVLGWNRAFSLTLGVLWLLPYTRSVHERYPLHSGRVHADCRADHVDARFEARGIRQDKRVYYAALYWIIETGEALYLYDTPTSAIAVPKADVSAEELELLRECLVAHIDQTPPIRRQVYRRLR